MFYMLLWIEELFRTHMFSILLSVIFGGGRSNTPEGAVSSNRGQECEQESAVRERSEHERSIRVLIM
jgi:hypothetical protein